MVHRIHRIHRIQTLPVTPDKAWDFFSDPCNLARITPPWMDFRIVSGCADHTYPGQIIEYRVRPFPLVRLGWLTEITQARSPVFFVDEQRRGPYAFWHHQHHFAAVENGAAVRMTDLVHWALPWYALPVRALVRRRLRIIFDYRQHALERLLGRAEQGEDACRA
ncbi:Ligand-binding SRPBCC domain-containing protein [Paucidesulfovibrio gracilis DSM 16080]|uniref:Ligand-binding SRPBCC domain-containing protein n=1 Tax=Paucidesulfovibrio gracilis DSM 16080 TaxID=1121449 RepID=A0A1T4WY21_9BACT|nr:SRPBCC family protein [Paucidesulfovibrio gracilis]SKA82149.1 Ligand-binding SRPBCC domain-containing protein [Paucidesulfovibrio gracilis DSM 16080]